MTCVRWPEAKVDLPPAVDFGHTAEGLSTASHAKVHRFVDPEKAFQIPDKFRATIGSDGLKWWPGTESNRRHGDFQWLG